MNRLALPLFLLLIAAPSAFATEGPPIDVTVPPLANLPTEGATIDVAFEILSHVNATISGVGFTAALENPEDPLSGYWTEVSNDAPASIPMTAMVPFVVNAQVVCNDPNESITIGFDVDGYWFEASIFLVPLADRDLWATPVPMKTASSRYDESLAIPPLPSDFSLNTANSEDEEDALGKVGPLRVSGRLVYRREDLVEVGADGVLVQLWDEDTGEDDLISTQITDPWGNFDIITYFNQNEKPDLYIKAVMSNGVARVVYPGTGLAYGFRTSTSYDFGGTHLAFGDAIPSDPQSFAALHMMTTISRGWRFLDTRGYGTIPRITLSWPEAVNPPFYSSGSDLIHMNVARQF